MLALDADRAVQTDEPPLGSVVAARIPFAATIRQVIRHRPGTRVVPVSRLLMGGQARLDATAFAKVIGTLRMGSTPVAEGPHTQLLETARVAGRPLTDEELLATPYLAFARQIAVEWGNYFGATSDAELLELARGLIDWGLGDSATRLTKTSGSKEGDGVLVAKVSGSDAYQVMDGHHRVAVATLRGETHVRVQRTWLNAETPLMWRLGDAARKARSLCQPLPARELDAWRVERNCTDRLVRMERFVHSLPEMPAAGSYLDVGVGFGWFLAAFRSQGWRVTGIATTEVSVDVATSFFDVARSDLACGDAVALLEGSTSTHEVVACLDVEAVLPQGPDRLARLLAALDERTGRVLFVEEPDDDPSVTLRALAATRFAHATDLGVSADPDGTRPSRLVALTR